MKKVPKINVNILFISAGIFIIAGLSLIFYFSLFSPKKTSSTSSFATRRFTLIVDAGHGGIDDGSMYDKLKEKNITLAIAEKIKSEGPKFGINVIMTRDSDKFMNPLSRIFFAAHQNADVYVSIHVNELRSYNSVSGMQVYVSDSNPKFLQSCALGSAIAKDLSTDFKVFKKLQDRTRNIYVLSKNNLPSVLVESGFMTNLNDLKILTDSSKQTLIADRILEGVSMYKDHLPLEMYAVQMPKIFVAKRTKNIIASSSITPKSKTKKANKLT